MRKFLVTYDTDDKWKTFKWQFYRTRDLVVVYEKFQTEDYSREVLTDESWNEFPNGGRIEY